MDKSAKIIAITSGKGGVGKSIISANMANILSYYGYRVVVVDVSFGLSNQDIIFHIPNSKNLLHYLKDEASLGEIMVEIKQNLFLIPSESGNEIFDFDASEVIERLITRDKILDMVDYLIFDTSSGIYPTVESFIEASDEVIVVTEPTPTAITDAYATIKIASNHNKSISMILNRVSSSHEGNLIFDKIDKVATQNLNLEKNIEFLGSISTSKIIEKTSKYRELFTSRYPNSNSSYELNEIIKKFIKKLEHKVLHSHRRKSFTVFVRHLIEKF